MNFIIIFFTTLVAICFAQAQDTPADPQVELLETIDGCALEDVLQTVSCGCFISLFEDPSNREIRRECKSVTGNSVRNSQSACAPFLIEDGTNYDFQGIMDSVMNVGTRCFSTDSSVAQNNVVQSRRISFRMALKILKLIWALIKIFSPSTASRVPILPNLYRVPATQSAVKGALLRQFNSL